MDIDWVATTIVKWEVEKNKKTVLFLEHSNNIYTDYLCRDLQLYTPSIFFRKKFLEKKELFKENLLRGQELDFFLRLFFNKSSGNFILNSNPTVLYRSHNSSKSSQNKKYNSAFHVSKYLIYKNHFVKNISSGNTDALNYCYKRLVSAFYLSLLHRDTYLSKKIKNEVFPLLYKLNYFRAIEINIIGRILYSMRKDSWRIYQRWKNFNFISQYK